VGGCFFVSGFGLGCWLVVAACANRTGNAKNTKYSLDKSKSAKAFLGKNGLVLVSQETLTKKHKYTNKPTHN
jgi:hypothetical protein